MSVPATVIEIGTALLGVDLTPVRDAVVVVEAGAITGVGRRDQVESPPKSQRVHAPDSLLMPGFIDAHVHIGFFEPQRILANGVTTVRDLAWPPEVIFDLARRSQDANFDGPTVLAAGPMLTAPGGYPTRAAWAPQGTGLPVTTPEQGREAVNRVAEMGATIIKIALNPDVGPVLDESTVTAIVDAAHDRGLKVTGHISGLAELEKALRAGVDELAHMLMSEERIPDDMIGRMVARDMAVVPTLSIRFGSDKATAIENLKSFAHAGGRVVYGTDLGNEGPQPGIDPLEVEAMALADLKTADIVRSATVDAADWIGLRDTGVIEVGAHADLVSVPATALDSARDLCRVEMVWRRGRRVR